MNEIHERKNQVKATAIILILVCLAAFVGLGYLYMTSSVIVTDVELAVCEANTQTALFGELKTQVTNGNAAATIFSENIPETPDECVFLQYSVKLENKTFVPAEQIEIRVTPSLPGDYVQMAETMPVDLAPGKRGTVNAVLLAEQKARTTREMIISYYLWGLPFFIRTTYSR